MEKQIMIHIAKLVLWLHPILVLGARLAVSVDIVVAPAAAFETNRHKLHEEPEVQYQLQLRLVCTY